MDNPYIMSLTTQAGVILTALFSLIGIIYQTKNSNKTKHQNETLDELHKEIIQIKEENEQRDLDIVLDELRRYIVTQGTSLENGDNFNEEQKRCLSDSMKRYDSLGGDGYIHTLWNRLLKKNLIDDFK